MRQNHSLSHTKSQPWKKKKEKTTRKNTVKNSQEAGWGRLELEDIGEIDI